LEQHDVYVQFTEDQDEEGGRSKLVSAGPQQRQITSRKEKIPRLKICPHCNSSLDDENKGNTTFDLIKHNAIGSIVKHYNKMFDRVHRTLSPSERLDAVYGSVDTLPSLVYGIKVYDADLIAALHIPEELSGLDSRLARAHGEVRESINRRKQEMRRLLSREYVQKVDDYLQEPAWRNLYRNSFQIFVEVLKR
jgi:hypothetical protein